MLSCKNKSEQKFRRTQDASREHMPQEFDGNKIQIDVLLHRQPDPSPWTSPHSYFLMAPLKMLAFQTLLSSAEISNWPQLGWLGIFF